ncbi:MAG: sugar phosphate isomerase/epimerase family protein [Candidatus Zipacnadales bacterium]
MKIGALTAAWAGKPLEEVLDFFAANGLQAVEIGTGNFPPDAHCNPFKLNEDAAARKAFMKAITSRNMVLSALSCHGNPLHPNAKIAKQHHDVFVATVELARKLGIHEVNGFSGLPGGAKGDKVPNWVTAPWPEDHLAALEYQWNEVAIPYWKEQNAFLEKNKVNMCFEMHPNFLVYNPETLIKLRKACGKRICANFDPSHLFWQGIDPTAAIRWLSEHGDIIKHVHAKDSLVYQWNAKVNGVLDTKHYGDEIHRSWIFRTVGYGHDASVWKDIVSTLRMVGYDGTLSIEHEDSLMSNDEGFLKAVALLKEAVIFQAPTAMTWA